MNNIRETIISFYLDWVNNWLTPASMAAYYNVSVEECKQLIDLGLKWHVESLLNKE